MRTSLRMATDLGVLSGTTRQKATDSAVIRKALDLDSNRNRAIVRHSSPKSTLRLAASPVLRTVVLQRRQVLPVLDDHWGLSDLLRVDAIALVVLGLLLCLQLSLLRQQLLLLHLLLASSVDLLLDVHVVLGVCAFTFCVGYDQLVGV